MTVLLDASAVLAFLPLAAAERLDVTVYTADGEWAAIDSSVRVELIR